MLEVVLGNIKLLVQSEVIWGLYRKNNKQTKQSVWLIQSDWLLQAGSGKHLLESGDGNTESENINIIFQVNFSRKAVKCDSL